MWLIYSPVVQSNYGQHSCEIGKTKSTQHMDFIMVFIGNINSQSKNGSPMDRASCNASSQKEGRSWKKVTTRLYHHNTTLVFWMQLELWELWTHLSDSWQAILQLFFFFAKTFLQLFQYNIWTLRSFSLYNSICFVIHNIFGNKYFIVHFHCCNLYVVRPHSVYPLFMP